jgi:predicted MPP superfamily phosphohydrolase
MAKKQQKENEVAKPAEPTEEVKLKHLTMVEYFDTGVFSHHMLQDSKGKPRIETEEVLLQDSDIHMKCFVGKVTIDEFMSKYCEELKRNCLADLITLIFQSLEVTENQYNVVLNECCKGDEETTVYNFFKQNRYDKGPVEIQGVYSYLRPKSCEYTN